MNYQSYLKSKDWQGKRVRKLNRKLGTKRRCAICGSKESLHVHHLSYADNLSKTKQKDLRVLCSRCHLLTHRLFKQGKIKFRSNNHHSRFAITKTAVKKSLGLTKDNLFAGAAEKPSNTSREVAQSCFYSALTD